jgi:hypothetical protein
MEKWADPGKPSEE